MVHLGDGLILNHLPGKVRMAKIDPAKVWNANYRLLMQVIAEAAPGWAALGLESKELFVLDAIDEHPHPAALAEALLMPKPTITVHLKRLEAAGLVKREIDPSDLRRHRLTLTPAGRKAKTKGVALLSEAFGKRLGRLSAHEQSLMQAMLEGMS
jgi:DNA-binding MarR family transcriptional regulator